LIIPQRNYNVDCSKIFEIKFACRTVLKVSLIASEFYEKKEAAEFED
jgi:hypothetical protein